MLLNSNSRPPHTPGKAVAMIIEIRTLNRLSIYKTSYFRLLKPPTSHNGFTGWSKWQARWVNQPFLTIEFIITTGYYLLTHLSNNHQKNQLCLAVCLFQWHGPLSFNLFCPGHPGPNPDLSGNIQLQLLYMIMPIKYQKPNNSIGYNEPGRTIIMVKITPQEALDYHNMPTPGKISIAPTKALDKRVCFWEAPAVAEAAMQSGLARRSLSMDEYRYSLATRMGI
jgi:hypothetical protein